MNCFAAHLESPLGPMVMVANGSALVGLYIKGQKHFPLNTTAWSWDYDLPVFAETRRQVAEYFAGQRQRFELPLEPTGTPFQQQVWEALKTIPYGSTRAYSEVARRIGKPTATRAVGAAVGRNPLTILVPCHRVMGQNGGVRGFAGGLERKRQLLELESAEPATQLV